MATSLAISRIMWGLLGVVTIALIISVTSLVLVVMEKFERIAELESRMMKERKENDKLIVDIKSQMTSWMKQGEENDKQWKDHISTIEMKMSSLENLTEDVVVFSVASKSAFAPRKVARVPMQTVLYNEGGHFHFDDNTFHAPFNGVYSFTFSAVADVNKWADVYLYTQKKWAAKVGVARAIDRGVSGSYGTASGSVVIQLEAGETVSVWSWADHSNQHSIRASNPPCTLFSGRLEKKT